MFNNARYVTSGIAAEIPEPLQLMLWSMIETMVVEKKDYLQVFELDIGLDNKQPIQKITHTQEVPVYKKEYYLKSDIPMKEKIFVIDDETHSTMLLASEY